MARSVSPEAAECGSVHVIRPPPEEDFLAPTLQEKAFLSSSHVLSTGSTYVVDRCLYSLSVVPVPVCNITYHRVHDP